VPHPCAQFAHEWETASYTYDTLNRLSTVVDSRLGTTTYTYDSASNVATVTYPDGVQSLLSHGELNRLNRVTGFRRKRRATSTSAAQPAQHPPRLMHNKAVMQDALHASASPSGSRGAPAAPLRAVYWLQGVTLAWMLLECAVALYAAYRARSVALLAFGSDSLVELFSAAVVLLSFLPAFPLSKDRAARWAGILLFALAAVIALTAVVSLALGHAPQPSPAGIAITCAALLVMPILARLKRSAARRTSSRALAADAVQSVTCAYLAAITLLGLCLNAIFHLSWFDSAAALAALPILVIEGRRALRGEPCACS
jgi:YD repeat-containing protein